MLDCCCKPPRRYRYEVLYVGRSHALMDALHHALADLSCLPVYCPPGNLWGAHALIKSEVPYAVLLFDEDLVVARGDELASFALSLAHRAGTPAIIVRERDDVQTVAEEVWRLLGARDVRDARTVWSRMWR